MVGNDITFTPEFETAARQFREGEGHLFVTGRAGTGKSTLLRHLRGLFPKATAVAAPTGLAAVNVGGQTIHSLFRLAPRLVDPKKLRKPATAHILRQLRYLIIDEVSMVRADLMDGVDRTLRLARERPREPFGGLRLILFGDLHQLAPVMQREFVPYFEDVYQGFYFFNAPAFREADCALIELGEIFRQTDPEFIDILNAFRNGDASDRHMRALNARVVPFAQMRNPVILTPTNQMAADVNARALNRLPGKLAEFSAEVTGTFDDGAFPTERTLHLKEGAKVVMLRNDAKGRWVNGSIARVSRIKGGSVFIELGGEEHEVEPVAWENSRYGLDEATKELTSTAVGKFKQLPMRLAWAMTIHKAQGMTLESVYLDMGRGAFAHGQTYVALSRCKTLEGLGLAREMRRSDIIFDKAALGYRKLFSAAGV